MGNTQGVTENRDFRVSSDPALPSDMCSTVTVMTYRTPLEFHQVHGENIKLFRNKKVARRVDSFCKALAFSNRAVEVNEVFCVKIFETSNRWSGVLRVGITIHDPAKYRQEDLPKYVCPDLTNKHGNWAKAISERYCEQNTQFHFFINKDGEMFYGVNGNTKGLFLSGIDASRPMWVVVDVYGNCMAVEFVDTSSVVTSDASVDKELNQSTLDPINGHPPCRPRQNHNDTDFKWRLDVRNSSASGQPLPTQKMTALKRVPLLSSLAASSDHERLFPLPYPSTDRPDDTCVSRPRGSLTETRVVEGSSLLRPSQNETSPSHPFARSTKPRIKPQFQRGSQRDGPPKATILPSWFNESPASGAAACASSSSSASSPAVVPRSSSASTTFPNTRSQSSSVLDFLGTEESSSGAQSPTTTTAAMPLPGNLLGSTLIGQEVLKRQSIAYHRLLYNSGTRFEPLKFHPLTGRHVTLSQQSTLATRNPAFNDQGYVFLEKPLSFNKKVVIQVLNVLEDRGSGLTVGVTSADPNRLQQGCLPQDSDLLLDRPEYWVVSKEVAGKLKLHDELGFVLTLEGELCSVRNELPLRLVAHVDQTQKLWLFFDLFGSTSCIRLVGQTHVTASELRRDRGSSSGRSESADERSRPAPLRVNLPPSSIAASKKGRSGVRKVTTPPAGGGIVYAMKVAVSTSGAASSGFGVRSSTMGPVNRQGNEHMAPSTSAATSANQCNGLTPTMDWNQQQRMIADDEEGELTEENECKVCMCHKIKTTLLPCGHCIMCLDCAKKMQATTGICPVCRKPIKSVVAIFLP